MANTVTTRIDQTTNKDLLKKGSLRKIFDTTVREAHSFWQTICNDVPTKDEYIRDLEMAGLETAAEIAEGQNIPIFSPVQGETKTYTQRQFGAGFRMTFKMDFFNKYNLWNRWSSDLGKVQIEAKDVEIATMFNNPTSTTLTCGTGFTSKALANNTHTGLLSGSTSDNYDNYINSGLSFTSLKSIRYYFKMLVDAMGMWSGADPSHLVIHPYQYPTARELLGSDGKPHEMSNTINYLPEIGLKIVEYPRLSSTSRYFVLSKNSSLYDINVVTAMSPRFFTKDAGDNTLDKVALSLQFFTYGWGDSRMFCLGI